MFKAKHMGKCLPGISAVVMINFGEASQLCVQFLSVSKQSFLGAADPSDMDSRLSGFIHSLNQQQQQRIVSLYLTCPFSLQASCLLC